MTLIDDPAANGNLVTAGTGTARREAAGRQDGVTHVAVAARSDSVVPDLEPGRESLTTRLVALAVVAERGAGARAVLPLTEVEAVARGVRGAILRHAIDPRLHVLSGHAESGAPLEGGHLAVLPVPMTDGGIGGDAIGAVIVRAGQAGVFGLAALARWRRSGMRLVLGRLRAWRLVWLDEASAGWRAMAAAIVGPSQRWVTLTPVALDRNPGNLFASDAGKRRAAWAHAEATIGEACVRAGLPRPVSVRASSEGWSAGVPWAGRFMPYPRDGRKPGRVCVHAAVEFAEPVAGPVVVGAGRYFGVGTLVAAHGRRGE